MRTRPPLIPALALAMVVAACGGGDETETFSGPCNLADALQETGQLTVAAAAAAGPAPWVIGSDPSDGRGFEAALVYTIADELGIDSVVWSESSRDEVLTPGGKDYDFAIQQLPITNEPTVQFSIPYYQVEQVIVGEPGTPIATVQSLADLREQRLGVVGGTNGPDYVETEIGPDTPALEFEDATAAAAGLAAGEIDGILLGLPAAYSMIAAASPDAAILFVLPRVDEEPEELGMAFAQSSRLVPCIDAAIEALRDEGTLAELELEWLDQQGRIPSLNP